MDTPEFRFRATAVFGAFRLGLVFCGHVVSGEAGEGCVLAIVGRERTHLAHLRSTGHQRKLIPRTRPGVELSLLLVGFDDPALRAAINTADEAGYLPWPEQLLGITLPIDLVEVR